MTLSERVRFKDTVSKSATRSHPGAEPDHVPSPHGGDAAPYRPPQPTISDRIEWHGKFWSSVRNICIGIAFAGGLVFAGFSWAVNKAVDARFDEAYRRLDPMVLRPTADQLKDIHDNGKPTPPTLEDRFNASAAALGEIRMLIDAPNNPQSELGRKLSSLDATLRERLPPRPNKPALPSVGPAAKAEGRP